MIKFLLKERCNVIAIHQRLVAVYGDSAPNNCTVQDGSMNSHVTISLWKMTFGLVGLRMQ